MKTSTLPLFAASVAVALLTTGCVSLKPEPTGFLSDLEQLKAADDRGTLVYHTPVSDGTVYHAVMLAPLAVDRAAAEAAGLAVADIDRLAATLHADLAAVLGQRFEVVDWSGPGVLLVRTAVSGIETSNPAVNTVSVLALGVAADPGGIVVELEARDSQSHRRLAARVEGRGAKIYQVFSGLSSTGQAKSGFRRISQAFLADLDAVARPAAVVASR